METSAKDSTNVEQAFMAMAAAIKNRYPFLFIIEWHILKKITEFNVTASELSPGKIWFTPSRKNN